MPLLLVQGCSFSTVRAPSWAVSPPSGYRYQYVTGTGSGSDVAIARRAALEDAYQLLRQSGPRAYQSAAFRQAFESVARQSVGPGGVRDLTTTQELRTSGAVDGTIEGTDIPRLEIVSTEIGRCRRCTEYTVFVLFRYPKPRSQQRPPPSTAGVVARSLFIPGWGQMAKGQRAKGWSLLTLTLSGAGTALYAQQQRQAAFGRAKSATTQAARDADLSEAARWKTMLLGGVSVGGAAYGVSVIDVISVAPSYYPSTVTWPAPALRAGIHLRVDWPFALSWPVGTAR
jgi:hypothetical protein